MIDTKDLMWAVWCLVAAFVSYRVGHFLGFKLGIEVAKATIGKLVMEGKIDVTDAIKGGRNA